MITAAPELLLTLRPNRHQRPGPGEVLATLEQWRASERRARAAEPVFAQPGKTYSGEPMATPAHTSGGVYDRLLDPDTGVVVLIQGGRYAELDPYRSPAARVTVRFAP